MINRSTIAKIRIGYILWRFRFIFYMVFFYNINIDIDIIQYYEYGYFSYFIFFFIYLYCFFNLLKIVIKFFGFNSSKYIQVSKFFNLFFLFKFILCYYVNIDLLMRKLLFINIHEKNKFYFLRFFLYTVILFLLYSPFFLFARWYQILLHIIKLLNWESYNIDYVDIMFFLTPFTLIFIENNVMLVYLIILWFFDSFLDVTKGSKLNIENYDFFFYNDFHYMKLTYFFENLEIKLLKNNCNFFNVSVSKTNIPFFLFIENIISQKKEVYNVLIILRLFYKYGNTIFFLIYLKEFYFNEFDIDSIEGEGEGEGDENFRYLFKDCSLEQLLSKIGFLYHCGWLYSDYVHIYKLFYEVVFVMKNNKTIFNEFCKFAKLNEFYYDKPADDYNFLLKQFEQILHSIYQSEELTELNNVKETR